MAKHSPSTDTSTIHIIECCFGKFGRAFLETDPQAASEAHIVADIVSGQVDNPIIRILSVKLGERSEDVTGHIAGLVFGHFEATGNLKAMSEDMQAFCERSGMNVAAAIREEIAEANGWQRHIRSTRAA